MASKRELERRIRVLTESLDELRVAVSEQLNHDSTEFFGERYPTVQGRIKAIEQHLGIGVSVTERKVVGGEVVATKIKKGKK